MGGENFIAKIGAEMEQNGHRNTAAAFHIKPVHQQHKNYQAEYEVGRVKRAFGKYLALVIALHKGERQVPKRPKHAEYQR